METTNLVWVVFDVILLGEKNLPSYLGSVNDVIGRFCSKIPGTLVNQDDNPFMGSSWFFWFNVAGFGFSWSFFGSHLVGQHLSWRKNTSFLRKHEHWVVVSNIFYFHPYLGKISILTNIFQMGWNHQLEKISTEAALCCHVSGSEPSGFLTLFSGFFTTPFALVPVCQKKRSEDSGFDLLDLFPNGLGTRSVVSDARFKER